MNLNNYFWWFKDALPHRFCDDVIKYALSHKESLAITGDYHNKKNLNKKEENDLKKTRNSNIVWLEDPWIYKELHPYVHIANKMAGWNFEWTRSESCQFTKYKINQHYDWHCDGWNKPYDKPGPNNGLIRKISMTCQLTDGSEYKGGELEFDFRNVHPNKKNIISCNQILSKGSIVLFPSFVWHRVKPVTSGTRYSLVVWNLGKVFR